MVTIILMQTATPALQRDLENAVFQAIVREGAAGVGRTVRPRDALFGIERTSCNEKTYLN